MRIILFFFLLLFAASGNSFSQLLNGSFEQWQNGEPVSWVSNDISGDMISQSSDAYDGNSSIKIQAADFMGTGFPPFFFSSDLERNGHPINQRYSNLKGYYKLSAFGEDVLWISVVITESDSTVLGGGMIYLHEEKTNWTEFNIPINYDNNIGTPQMVYVTVALLDTGAGGANINSIAFLDKFSLENTTPVEDEIEIVDNFILEQNYPNPFNPSTIINFQLPEDGFVSLKVYDILGNEIMNLIEEEKTAGRYEVNFNASNFASGVYIYRLEIYSDNLKTADFISSRRMLLLK